jgi:hypothetical protein
MKSLNYIIATAISLSSFSCVDTEKKNDNESHDYNSNFEMLDRHRKDPFTQFYEMRNHIKNNDKTRNR